MYSLISQQTMSANGQKISASELVENIHNTKIEIIKQLKHVIDELVKAITVQLTELSVAIGEIKETLSMLTPATKKPIKKQADDETDEETPAATPAPKKTPAKRATAKRTAATKAAAANAETEATLTAPEKPEEAQADQAEEPAAKKAAAAPKKTPAKRTGAKKTAAAKKAAAVTAKEEPVAALAEEGASDEPAEVAKATAAPKKTTAPKSTAAKASPVVPATLLVFFKQKYVEDEKFRDKYALPEATADLGDDPNYTKLKDERERFKYEADKIYKYISKNDKNLLGKIKTEYEQAKAAAKPEVEQLNEESFSDD